MATASSKRQVHKLKPEKPDILLDSKATISSWRHTLLITLKTRGSPPYFTAAYRKKEEIFVLRLKSAQCSQGISSTDHLAFEWKRCTEGKFYDNTYLFVSVFYSEYSWPQRPWVGSTSAFRGRSKDLEICNALGILCERKQKANQQMRLQDFPLKWNYREPSSVRKLPYNRKTCFTAQKFDIKRVDKVQISM